MKTVQIVQPSLLLIQTGEVHEESLKKIPSTMSLGLSGFTVTKESTQFSATVLLSPEPRPPPHHHNAVK